MDNLKLWDAISLVQNLLAYRETLQREAGEDFDSLFDSPRLTDREWEAITKIVDVAVGEF